MSRSGNAFLVLDRAYCHALVGYYATGVGNSCHSKRNAEREAKEHAERANRRNEAKTDG